MLTNLLKDLRLSCVQTFLSAMECKRNSVVALYLAGKPQVAIVRGLKHLNVNKSFVSRTIARFRDTGSVAKRHGGGHKKTATSAEMVRKVKAQIEGNPRQSGRKMARELNISLERMQHILKNELGLKPLEFQKPHDLAPQQKKVTLKKTNKRSQVGSSVSTSAQQPPAQIICDVCKETGTTQNPVFCDKCHKNYHFSCLDPPLKKTPKRRGYSWHCADCDPTDVETT